MVKVVDPRPWALGAGVGAALAAVVSGWPHWQVHSLAAVITVLECGTTAAAGVLLATARRTRPSGVLLLVAALCWALTWLSAWNTGVGPLFGVFAQSFFFVAGSVGILYYPDGRLHGRPERWWAIAAVVVLIGSQVALCLATPPTIYGFDDDVVWPWVFRSHGAQASTLIVVTTCTIVLAAAFAGVIWWRQRLLKGVERAMTLPVLAAVAVVGLLSAFVQTGAITGLDRQLDTYLVQGTLALSVPLSLLAVGLRRRWAEVAVADQLLQLTRPPSADRVRDAFRVVLRDPTLDVSFWVPRQGQYVDHAGRVVDPPDDDPARWRLPVETERGHRLAIVDVDAALKTHEGLVTSALLAGRRALENAQLQTEVQARIEQVRAAQMRLLQAEATERQRMERDLHDGAQQRLVALAMRLAAVEASIEDPETREQLREAREAATQALAELRAFARGIHPGQLTEEGLPAALESLAERLDLAVDLQVTDVRPSPGLERALYLALAEALTNAARHAGVDEVAVLVHVEDQMLVGEVCDAGRGGAKAKPNGGLAGMRDQARALGGDVEIVSAEKGTTIRVRLPLD
ncbi:sensor histidine kinase [Cryptosporangium phraense]|uniref:histidine kinase n=1 Tax=Cryptosporangium phraense TaxID=2593070 RepID=A0A545AJP6_9ACTN|nr:histidine kinase [Cryptosporangium phraense]TQS41538.1 sensor histidine kinase [Cryptosporangium phraense]